MVSLAKVVLKVAESLRPLSSDIWLRSPSSRTMPWVPFLSNGLAERRLIRPPIAPSVSDAWAPLITSAPLMTSAGNTSNAKSRPAPSVARMRLLNVVSVYSGPRPRTLTR